MGGLWGAVHVLRSHRRRSEGAEGIGSGHGHLWVIVLCALEVWGDARRENVLRGVNGEVHASCRTPVRRAPAGGR